MWSKVTRNCNSFKLGRLKNLYSPDLTSPIYFLLRLRDTPDADDESIDSIIFQLSAFLRRVTGLLTDGRTFLQFVAIEYIHNEFVFHDESRVSGFFSRLSV